MKSGITLSELVKEALETSDEKTLVAKLMKRLKGDKNYRISVALNSLSDLVETIAFVRYIKEAKGKDELVLILKENTQVCYRLLPHTNTETWVRGVRLGKWLKRRYGRRIYEGL